MGFPCCAAAFQSPVWPSRSNCVESCDLIPLMLFGANAYLLLPTWDPAFVGVQCWVICCQVFWFAHMKANMLSCKSRLHMQSVISLTCLHLILFVSPMTDWSISWAASCTPCSYLALLCQEGCAAVVSALPGLHSSALLLLLSCAKSWYPVDSCSGVSFGGIQLSLCMLQCSVPNWLLVL